MNLFFLHHSIKDLNDKPGERAVVTFREPEQNINEGGEFLDDAIRVKEQPLITGTEENIAAGSRENFL